MSDGTRIEWADATLNYANGCTVVSPGCTNCYAMRLAGTRMKHHPSRIGLTQPSKAGPVWTGEVRLNEAALLAPLRWRRPRRIFWNAHGDLFHEGVSDAAIDRLFAVAALTPQHRHLILTKRSARMREYVSRLENEPHRATVKRMAAAWPHPIKQDMVVNGPNVWLGVSVEDQPRADERIPDLLATPAAIRFLSCEPLLAAVDLNAVPWDVAGYRMTGALPTPDEPDDFRFWHHKAQGIAWVIVGAESGRNARPMANEWAQDIVDQCQAAGVAVFVKQLSAGVRANHDIASFPEGLRVRQFPVEA